MTAQPVTRIRQMTGNAKPDTTSANTRPVKVWRGDGSGGRFVGYQVPRRQNQTVLDVITWIQRHLEPGLSYRFACRVGMCGSCAMTVNGKPRWTCRTHVGLVGGGDTVTIAPLRNLPVIKDLVCDMSTFFNKWQRAEGRFQGSRSRHEPIPPQSPQSPQRQAANAAIECINCAVCYAACDVVAWNSEYLGPAALNRAWTLVNDSRDQAQIQRLQAVAGTGGCQNCHSQHGCATYCPVGLNPTRSIAGLKRAVAKAVLTGQL